MIGEAVLLARAANDLRIFGSGCAAVTTIPPVLNLLGCFTTGDGAAEPLTPFGVPFALGITPVDVRAVVDGTLSNAFRGEPIVESELVASSRRD